MAKTITKPKKWTEAEIFFLKENYSTMPFASIAEVLGRTDSAIRCKCKVLGLLLPSEIIKKRRANTILKTNAPNFCTEEEGKTIEDNYLIVPLKRLAKQMGRSNTFVRNYLKRNNLIVPPDIIERRKQEAKRKKGDVPHNKGQKMPEKTKEKLRHTFFKKGHLPHNAYESDGAISMRKDNDGRPYPHTRIALAKWMPYQRYIWEQAYGPIPDNCLIVFKNKDTTDIRLENLELISRQDNADRNISKNAIELQFNYVRGVIKRGTGLKNSDIPDDLVLLKRNELQVKRFLKNIEKKEDANQKDGN